MMDWAAAFIGELEPPIKRGGRDYTIAVSARAAANRTRRTYPDATCITCDYDQISDSGDARPTKKFTLPLLGGYD
jgi:hypothetical protein